MPSPKLRKTRHQLSNGSFIQLLTQSLLNFLAISDNAVDAGVAAIKAGAKVVTDVKMIKARY